MTARTIAFSNQKGGVGRSAAGSLGLTHQGKKVLFIDNDPQAALAISPGYPKSDELPILTHPERKWITEIPLNELHAFENYPFHVWEDAAMQENVESIQEGGTVRPCLVRPREAGGYEVIAGQRDVRACELAGLRATPAVIQELDDDTATLLMVNANLPQEKVLPSELAWALRMKMEALCHRGRQVPGLNPGMLSVEILMEQTGKSKNQIYRYVHLTELIPALMDMVDAEQIGFSIAADYLYQLSRMEQCWLLDSMGKYEVTPSVSQAMRLRKLGKVGDLTPEVIDEIMSEEKKEPIKVTLAGNRLTQYFPKSYTPREMESIIISLLEGWHQKQEKAS